MFAESGRTAEPRSLSKVSSGLIVSVGHISREQSVSSAVTALCVGVLESDVSSTDTASETGDTGDRTGRDSLAEQVAPSLGDHARSGNLAVASGVVSLVRGGRTLLRGDRKRGLAQALVGLLLVGLALAQRRRKGGPEMSDVVDTGPDIESAVEPGERETDHATGESVVDTKSADIEESDTAPEVESDAARGDVDQRGVAGTDDLESVESDGRTADSDDETDETESE